MYKHPPFWVNQSKSENQKMQDAFQSIQTNPSLFINKPLVFGNQVLLGLTPKCHLFVCSWHHMVMSLQPLGGLSLPSCTTQFSTLQSKQLFSNIISSLQSLLNLWEESRLLTMTSKVLCDGATLTFTPHSLPCPLSPSTVVE